MSVAGWVWLYVPPALLAAYVPDGRLGDSRFLEVCTRGVLTQPLRLIGWVDEGRVTLS